MGRPRASVRNRRIALAFCQALTIKERGTTIEDSISFTAQFGRKSLHSAMIYCLPDMTRRGTLNENREGVSEMELNKLMRIQGHTMIRKYDALCSGEKLRREWAEMRWLNLSTSTQDTSASTQQNTLAGGSSFSEEVSQLADSLSALHRDFPETQSCTLERVTSFVISVRKSNAQNFISRSRRPALACGLASAQLSFPDDCQHVQDHGQHLEMLDQQQLPANDLLTRTPSHSCDSQPSTRLASPSCESSCEGIIRDLLAPPAALHHEPLLPLDLRFPSTSSYAPWSRPILSTSSRHLFQACGGPLPATHSSHLPPIVAPSLLAGHPWMDPATAAWMQIGLALAPSWKPTLLHPASATARMHKPLPTPPHRAAASIDPTALGALSAPTLALLQEAAGGCADLAAEATTWRRGPL